MADNAIALYGFMLARRYTGRRYLGSRAIFAAVLFALLVIVTSVLPHQHFRTGSDAKAHGAAVLEASAASCVLCDWLSLPHLPAAPAASVAHAPTVDWQQPVLPALVCVPGFAVLRDSPQRGPPPVLPGFSYPI